MNKLKINKYILWQVIVSAGIVVLCSGTLITAKLLRDKNLVEETVHAATTAQLKVNSANQVNTFSNRMLGLSYANWMHSWGKPFVGDVTGLTDAVKEINSGLIRYAGGLWTNSVGFDRTNQRTPYTAWTANGNTYYFHYGINEIDSLAKYSKNTNADVMIEVNISTNDPKMWADMVKYTNKDHSYNFKYWELGNEIDLECFKNNSNCISPDEYISRAKNYIAAMIAVDPTIKFVLGVSSSASNVTYSKYSADLQPVSEFITKSAVLTSTYANNIYAVSWHWYQNSYGCDQKPIDLSTKISDVSTYDYKLDPRDWHNSYSRIWSQIGPTNVKNEAIKNTSLKQGMSEMNFDACNNADTGSELNGNHLTALWLTDVLGRLAYNGVDFVTFWLGYNIKDNSFSPIYPDNENSVSRVYVRPTYYSYLMYAKYFGNQIVESSSSMPDKISIWASKDSKDPNKIKVMITNLTAENITASVDLSGVTASNGSFYTLSSTSPTDVSSVSETEDAPTTLNGVKIHGNTIAADFSKIQPVNKAINANIFQNTFAAYTSTSIILTTGNLPTNTPTPVITSTIATTSCTCQTDVCSLTCTFEKDSTSTYPPQIKCSRESSLGVAPDAATKTSYCQRTKRTLGDADGNNIVDDLDYFYYVRSVNGGTMPSSILSDFNGDGFVSPTDRKILINSLKI